MADYCHNMIEFIGNDAALAELKRWRELLDSFEPTNEDPHCMRAFKAVFYPELAEDENPDYGSKWVYQDNVSVDVNDNQLSLQSAWNRPEMLENRMACLLFPFDPNLIIRNNFYIGESSGGIAYTTPLSSESAYSQEAFFEIDRDEFDDSFEADDYLDSQLEKEEKEMLTTFFLDDVPHLAKVLRAYMPHLAIDWHEFEDRER